MKIYFVLAWLISLLMVAGITEHYTAKNVHAAEKALRVDAMAQARVDQVNLEALLDKQAADGRRDAATAAAQVEKAQSDARAARDALAREVSTHVTAQADAACTLTNGFVWVHDHALSGTVPDEVATAPASGPESVDGPAGVRISEAAAKIADNYASAHEWEIKTRGLRAHVEALEKFYNNLKDTVHVCK